MTTLLKRDSYQKSVKEDLPKVLKRRNKAVKKLFKNAVKNDLYFSIWSSEDVELRKSQDKKEAVAIVLDLDDYLTVNFFRKEVGPENKFSEIGRVFLMLDYAENPINDYDVSMEFLVKDILSEVE